MRGLRRQLFPSAGVPIDKSFRASRGPSYQYFSPIQCVTPAGLRYLQTSQKAAAYKDDTSPADVSLGRINSDVRSLCDLRQPHSWYQTARKMKRTVHLHVGPTNSGKTHQALQALKAARTGIYCGPLRLLAWELYERLNAEGTACNLLTGQEREEVEGAAHVSCTVEMVDVDTAGVDVAVLDEIQMIGDPDRGWAWSRVLLGLAAPTIHACGDPSAVPLVKSLLKLTGDEVIVHDYSRLSPLNVAQKHVTSMASIQRGDCVIAFSRRDLFKAKREIESATGLRCGVIYGALPPGVRREQARRFNMHSDAGPQRKVAAPPIGVTNSALDGGDGESSIQPLPALLEPVDVLVATDAIGMGLNLAIKRVLFSRLDKFDGTMRRPLNISEMKQIGGRAGRFGSAFPVGIVSAFKRQHLPQLSTALASPTPLLRSAGVLPQLEQLEQFAAALIGMPDESDSESGSDSDTDQASEFDERSNRARRGVRESAKLDDAPVAGTLDSPAGWAGILDGDGNYIELRVGRGAATATEGNLSVLGALEAGLVSADGDLGTSLHSPAQPAGSLLDLFRDDDSDVVAMLSLNLHLQGAHAAYPSSLAGATEPLPTVLTGGNLVDGVDVSPSPSNSSEGDSNADSDDDAGELDAIVDGRLRSHASKRVRRLADDSLARLPFSAILEGFLSYARVNTGLYHLCDCSDLLKISRALDVVQDMPFRVRYAWCLAPVDVDDPLVVTAIKRYARKFVERGRVRVGLRVPDHAPHTPSELAELESAHSVFDLYLWLGRRYPHEFIQVDEARAAAHTTQVLIQQGLEAMGDDALALAAKRRSDMRRSASARSDDYAASDDEDSGEDRYEGRSSSTSVAGPHRGGTRVGSFASSASDSLSEYARSMLAANDDEDERGGDYLQRGWGSGGGFAGGARGSHAEKAAAKDKKRAKKEARRAGRQVERQALTLLEGAFAKGGLKLVRSLQRDPAWQRAMQEAIDARTGAAALRDERRGGSRRGGSAPAPQAARGKRGATGSGHQQGPRQSAPVSDEFVFPDVDGYRDVGVARHRGRGTAW